MSKQEKLEEMLERYPHIWKTESAFYGFIRGGVRRSLWNRHPVKLEFIRNNRYKIKNPNPRGKVAEVWGGRCALTGREFVLSELEVDHKVGNHSMKKLRDIQAFVEAISLVVESDLQFVSKDAHKSKSYADKHGMTFEQACAQRQAIAIVKSKQDLTWLTDRGIIPASSAPKRRVQIVQALTKE